MCLEDEEANSGPKAKSWRSYAYLQKPIKMAKIVNPMSPA